MIKLAINGFGRIGRQAFKIALEKPEIEIVAINDLADTQTLVTLLKYDTVYGVYSKSVGYRISSYSSSEVKRSREALQGSSRQGSNSNGAGYLIIDGRRFLVLAEKEPEKLPWKKLNVDVVLECTGRLTKDGAAQAHIKAGAKKVIVSAPTTNETKTYLLGVNVKDYKGEAVISNASCTTNCVSPVAAVIHKKFGIVKAMMSTIHAYTAEQNLVDGPTPPLHRDLRRARAAAQNIVPTSTGAAISTTEVFPELKGKFDGMALRVPVVCGSLTDFTFLLNKKVTVAQVNKTFVEAEKHPFTKGVIVTTKEPIVSTDIIGNPASAIVDLSLTKVVDGDLVKVIAWYDNEWGYANRLVEMAMMLGSKK